MKTEGSPVIHAFGGAAQLFLCEVPEAAATIFFSSSLLAAGGSSSAASRRPYASSSGVYQA